MPATDDKEERYEEKPIPRKRGGGKEEIFWGSKHTQLREKGAERPELANGEKRE